MARRKPDFSALPEWGTGGRRLKKLPDGGLAIGTDGALGFDESAMSATFVISTPTPDRIGDVLLSSGCNLDNYRKNPVVLWEHGLGGIAFPIARSEDPEGRLTIAVGDSNVIGTAYFTDKILESEQIFTLIVERMIRASSVRFTPLETEMRRDDGETSYTFPEWDLEEWSPVGIPCNPEAVNGIIAKNRLAGRPISPPLLKSLQLWLPERAVQKPGWRANEPSEVDVAKSNKKPADDPKVKTTKAAGPDEEEPEEETPAADEPAPEDEPKQEPQEDTPQDPGEMKQGQQVLSALYASLSQLLAQADAAVKPVEQSDIVAKWPKLQSKAEELLAMIGEVHGKAYPDAPPLTSDVPPEDTDEPAVKAFLASAEGPQDRMASYCRYIDALATEKTLRPERKRHLAAMAKQMRRWIEEAKAHDAASQRPSEAFDPQILTQLTEQSAANRKALAAASQQLKDVLPRSA